MNSNRPLKSKFFAWIQLFKLYWMIRYEYVSGDAPEEYEAVSNWLRNTFPDGQCPMWQTRFYPDDPNYTNVVLNTHKTGNYVLGVRVAHK
jgi:hypothetical protein